MVFWYRRKAELPWLEQPQPLRRTLANLLGLSVFIFWIVLILYVVFFRPRDTISSDPAGDDMAIQSYRESLNQPTIP